MNECAAHLRMPRRRDLGTTIFASVEREVLTPAAFVIFFGQRHSKQREAEIQLSYQFRSVNINQDLILPDVLYHVR